MTSSEADAPLRDFESLFTHAEKHGLDLLRYLTPLDVATLSGTSKRCRHFFSGITQDAILVQRWWMGQCIILLTSQHLHDSFESDNLPWKDRHQDAEEEEEVESLFRPENLFRLRREPNAGSWKWMYGRLLNYRKLWPSFIGRGKKDPPVDNETETWIAPAPREIQAHHIAMDRYELWGHAPRAPIADIEQALFPPPSPSDAPHKLTVYIRQPKKNSGQFPPQLLSSSQVYENIRKHKFRGVGVRSVGPRKTVTSSADNLRRRYIRLKHHGYPAAFEMTSFMWGSEMARNASVILTLLIFFYYQPIWEQCCRRESNNILDVACIVASLLEKEATRTPSSHTKCTLTELLTGVSSALNMNVPWEGMVPDPQRIPRLWLALMLYRDFVNALVNHLVAGAQHLLETSLDADNNDDDVPLDLDRSLSEPLPRRPPFFACGIDVPIGAIFHTLEMLLRKAAVLDLRRQLQFTLGPEDKAKTSVTEYEFGASALFQESSVILVLADASRICILEY